MQLPTMKLINFMVQKNKKQILVFVSDTLINNPIKIKWYKKFLLHLKLRVLI